MKGERLASDERRLVAAVAQILEKLTTRLDAGEPIPNALLGDAVAGLRAFADDRYDTGEHELETVGGGTQRAAAGALVGEMEMALEALERGEAGATGAFVIQTRACISLLRELAGLELPPQRSRKDEWMLLSDATWTSAHSLTLRHFKRLLEGYAKWTGHAR
jgi:hypothetical protein